MADDDLVKAFKSNIGATLNDPYSEVHVLLTSWAENDLGRGVEQEILDLRAVFEKEYNYNCASFPIPVDGSQQRRLNAELSSFVENQSRSSDSLIIIYYAGHCSANAQGQAEWAAFEKGGPTLSWHVAQQLLFSARGDVLLILDCCHASLITRGSKTDGGRFELIAASAIGALTPLPGRKSFTTALTRVLREHAAEGISSESLASKLREDPKVTETPVFHDFVRQSQTRIRLRRRQDQSPAGFMSKPRGYLLIKAPFSDDVTGMQIAQWLKTAPPDNITTVTIEAVVSYGRRVQSAFRDGVFPAGSLFEQFPPATRAQIARYMRSLNTVMATTAEHARDAHTSHIQTAGDERETIENSLFEMEDLASAIRAAVETPLLLDSVNGRSPVSAIEQPATRGDDTFYEVVAATDVDAALALRQAVLDDGPCRYSCEISRDKIVFDSPSTHRGGSGNNPNQRRFKFGTIDGRPVIMDKYKYREAPDHSGEPWSRRETSESDAAPARESPVGRFDLGRPYLFGFEYARAGDGTTYLDEDHSLVNNLYRHPDRWGRPTARFEKSHDVYALGVVLLEIALWKDVGAVVKEILKGPRVVAADVTEAMVQRCRKTLPHQVGDVFAQSVLACLEFGARTKGLGEYDAQVYFQENVVRLIKKAVRRV
ncbi:hypothetical protein CONLIGDRAFT_685394 [Coniochaeta ligniaria NRRL 30616]|uniref:Protein kinase domain-containing protein n=1 Tax=Coniochaeta ligniaria NRRL 30616 TaxID=1408157 RepID=A0A1J7I9R6_9PEZI|nr:hypothetical protein CONLIGDRAFT_685394 [Coniochaeta ligniaria NRRL 30616]